MHFRQYPALRILLLTVAASACAPEPRACVPTTCVAAGAECGELTDGCDGVLDCGGCTLPQTCGGGSVANRCGIAACVPDLEVCTRLAKDCDDYPDGCGGFVYCGECGPDEQCGGAMPPNTCGPDSCEHTTCASAGADCGLVIDICGDELDCGGCQAPLSCGGGGVPNVCGCTPEPDAELCLWAFAECGSLTAVDRCGASRTVDCGSCAGTTICGTLGANRCGCVPAACVAGTCGPWPDGCGVDRDCGPCPAPATCGLAAVGVCGCVPTDCATAGITCGELYDGCGALLDCGACTGTVPRLPLRIMAANLSSGNYQSYDPGEGIRIFQGLQPDVVAIQEFDYGDSSPWRIRELVITAFGDGFYFAREVGDIPNGIISRFPIIDAGEWDDPLVANRDFAWARIDLPGPRDLWVVSLHLMTTNASTRANEINALLPHLESAVPAGDYLVVAGDLNTKSRGETAVTRLADLLETHAPYPADQTGNTNTNANRDEPYDWVLVDADLAAYAVPTRIGSREFQAGLVFDSRVYTPLAEVAPVLAGDSAAVNMQHMAVVRDFAVPTR